MKEKTKVGSLEYKMTSWSSALDEDYHWTTIGKARDAGKTLVWAACRAGDRYEKKEYRRWREYRQMGVSNYDKKF